MNRQDNPYEPSASVISDSPNPEKGVGGRAPKLRFKQTVGSTFRLLGAGLAVSLVIQLIPPILFRAADWLPVLFGARDRFSTQVDIMTNSMSFPAVVLIYSIGWLFVLFCYTAVTVANIAYLGALAWRAPDRVSWRSALDFEWSHVVRVFVLNAVIWVASLSAGGPALLAFFENWPLVIPALALAAVMLLWGYSALILVRPLIVLDRLGLIEACKLSFRWLSGQRWIVALATAFFLGIYLLLVEAPAGLMEGVLDVESSWSVPNSLVLDLIYSILEAVAAMVMASFYVTVHGALYQGSRR